MNLIGFYYYKYHKNLLVGSRKELVDVLNIILHFQLGATSNGCLEYQNFFHLFYMMW